MGLIVLLSHSLHTFKMAPRKIIDAIRAANTRVRGMKMGMRDAVGMRELRSPEINAPLGLNTGVANAA